MTIYCSFKLENMLVGEVRIAFFRLREGIYTV